MILEAFGVFYIVYLFMADAEEAVCEEEIAVETTLLGGNFEIKRIINGLWQTSFDRSIPFAKMSGDMKKYSDAGLTTWDGADIYGPAETLMGAALSSGLQGQYFTKWVPRPGQMTESITRKAIGKSLKSMKTDKLDLVQFHWWSYSNQEYMNAMKHMVTLKNEGLIRHIGLTNFDTIRLKQMLDANIPIVSNQVSYSLLDWRPELKMVPVCEKHDVKLLCYGTLLGGFLSNRYLGKPEPRPETTSQRKYMPWIKNWGGWNKFQTLLGKLDKIGKTHEASISQVALRYILQKPAVGGVVVGTRLGIRDHIDDNLQTMQFQLSEEEIQHIEEITRSGRLIPGDCGDEYR